MARDRISRNGRRAMNQSSLIRLYQYLVLCWGLLGCAFHFYLYYGFTSGNPVLDETRRGMMSKLLQSKIQGQPDTMKAGSDTAPPDAPPLEEHCAINFFGLPRSFQDLVLPSIVENVLKPNAKYECDIFLHYYEYEYETEGRFSSGGRLNSTSVYELTDRVREIFTSNQPPKPSNASFFSSWWDSYTQTYPTVGFVKDTNTTFWESRGEALDVYLNKKNQRGKYAYFPYHAQTWKWPTSLINVVKQWHSIESVWNKMEETAKHSNKPYTRVAMLRNDVVYVTPIDIYNDGPEQVRHAKSGKLRGLGHGVEGTSGNIMTIPGFATFPVNDRMAYGPYGAIKTWATERFSKLEAYASDPPNGEKGWVMHAERYLSNAILPQVIRNGFIVEEDPSICFFRARADGSVLINDCDENEKHLHVAAVKRRSDAVSTVTGMDCGAVSKQENVHFAHCKKKHAR